ncbi:Hsp20/alpha crystallin family protein [Oscillochloris sp. ZM17-4]|uniref:Hsp20/alpha crystallin family protein n=1 Tax=Oscillochloris sp. ZM17-4 TaxID=2866714 RepID=UPI001C72F0FC|nr:gas vesicle protein GvpH [Oscillochloris sp. ZM17-4]MBX0328508.1 Hsp20/alpha crystallin family protein [Oscillochloris sp. ZM17-4]
MAEKKRPPTQAGLNLDLGLGGLFKNLGDLLDMASDLAAKAEAAGGEIARSGEFELKGMGEKSRGVYGFSIRSGIGGAPRVERFGNIRKTDEGPVVADVREPLVDIFDEGAEIVVVAELPGASEAQVQVELTGDILAISTSGDRSYAKEILLSSEVVPGSLRQTYTNGILEIRLQKA